MDLDSEHKQTLYLIRGHSGSGKSTLARMIQGHYWFITHKMVPVFEADQYFMKQGEYLFERDKLGEAHADCQLRTERALILGDTVIVANTFTRYWEMQPYFKMAERQGIPVQILICQGTFQNTHGLPAEVVEKQKTRLELWLTADGSLS